MPNWCSNNLTLTHDNPEMIKRAVAAFTDGRLLQEFVPCPQELLDGTAPTGEAAAQANIEKHGASDWYQWCIQNWGTKWDINNEVGDTDESEDGRSVVMSFDTAWRPPLEFYRTMEDDLGFGVKATYFEPGMSFVGKWDDGDNEHYDIDPENLDDIPQDLMDEWDISSWYDQDEDEDEDDENISIDLDGGLSAINEDDKDGEEV